MTDKDIGVRITADAAELKRGAAEARREIDSLAARARATSSATADLSSQAKAFVANLRQQADTLGLAKRELTLYHAAQLGLNGANLEAVRSSASKIAAFEQEAATLRTVTRAAGFAGAAIAAALGATAIASIKSALESEQSQQRVQAALKATGGAAGVTTGQIDRYTEALKKSSGFNDEDIRSAAASLLIYRDIQGKTFNEALSLSVDVAAFFGEKIPAAAERLGKALAAPEESFRLLKSVGVVLSESQKELIKSFDETGNKAAAQQIVLDALRGAIGGTGAETNKGLTGSVRGLKNAWDDMLESFGNSKSSPVARGFLDDLTTRLNNARIAYEHGNWATNALALKSFFSTSGLDNAAIERGEKARAEQQLGSSANIAPQTADRSVLTEAGRRFVHSLQNDQEKIREQIGELRKLKGLIPDDAYADLRQRLDDKLDKAINGKPKQAREPRDSGITRATLEASARAGALQDEDGFKSPGLETYFAAAAKIQPGGQFAGDSVAQQRAYAAAITVVYQQTVRLAKAQADRRQEEHDLNEEERAQQQLARENEQAALQEIAALDELNRSSKRYVEDLQFQNSLVGESAAEAARLTELRRIDQTVIDQSIGKSDEFRASLEGVAETMRGGVNAAFAESRRQLGDWSIGVKQALTEYSERARDVAGQSREVFGNAFRGIEDTLTRFVQTGKLDFKSLADSIIGDIIRIQIRAAETELLGSDTGKSVVGAIGKAIFGPYGASSGNQTDLAGLPGDAAQTFAYSQAHSGGIVGREAMRERSLPAAVFAGAPRYHSGGVIGADERPIIARRGEGVFTREQMRALSPAGGGPQSVRVEIVNQGTPQEVKQAQPTFDPQGMVIRVITSDLKSGGPVSQGIGNTFGLRRGR